MKNGHWEKNLFELIRRTATDLPSEVEAALRRGLRAEQKGSHAHWALQTMLENVALCRKEDLPLCQDSGTMTFYFSVPTGFDTNALIARTRQAVAKATQRGYLRLNTVETLSGDMCTTNVSHASPVMHFRQGARKTVDVRLIMKGGGCENVGRQYSLPDMSLNAERDLDGVRRCILDTIWRAQGAGCSPCVMGICLGGDRANGYAHAKEQFLHRLADRSRVKALARLEARILKEARMLGVGPMGLGGKTTLLGVNIGSLSRIPASYFVTVSVMCWAFRRRGAVLGPEGGRHRWLY